MKVTYIGDVERVAFDGHTFPRNEAVDYKGERLEKLQNNAFFTVEAPKKRAPKKAKAVTHADSE